MLDAFGVEGSERTLCREVRRLQGGHCMWLRREEWKSGAGGGRWSICRRFRTPKPNASSAFGELFQDAVALRMRSDVPIGTCLSGGFDSSAVICTMAAHEKAGMGPRDSTSWRHAFVATFPGASNDERPMAEEAAAWADVAPTFLEIGRADALTELDRILDDNDDVYIGLPSAAWLIYRELRRQNVTGVAGWPWRRRADGSLSPGRAIGSVPAAKRLAGLASGSPLARRGIDLLRALMIKRQGHYFLRGGLLDVPAELPLVGDDDVLPRDWGSLNRRLYRMFHSTVLPTILRNFDRLSMAHGIEVRMPFMDWRLVTYTMALPETSKSSNGYTKVIARQAMANLMPESIRMGRRKVGFNSPMPEWLNGPLAGWTASLLDRKVPAFAELVDEVRLRKTVSRLTSSKQWDWEIGRANLAVSEYEVDAGKVRVSDAPVSKQRALSVLFLRSTSSPRKPLVSRRAAASSSMTDLARFTF